MKNDLFDQNDAQPVSAPTPLTDLAPVPMDVLGNIGECRKRYELTDDVLWAEKAIGYALAASLPVTVFAAWAYEAVAPTVALMPDASSLNQRLRSSAFKDKQAAKYDFNLNLAATSLIFQAVGFSIGDANILTTLMAGDEPQSVFEDRKITVPGVNGVARQARDHPDAPMLKQRIAHALKEDAGEQGKLLERIRKWYAGYQERSTECKELSDSAMDLLTTN